MIDTNSLSYSDHDLMAYLFRAEVKPMRLIAKGRCSIKQLECPAEFTIRRFHVVYSKNSTFD